MLYHRMSIIGLRVLSLSTTINVLAICRSSVTCVWTLCKSPYELSQNDGSLTESSSFINHNSPLSNMSKFSSLCLDCIRVLMSYHRMTVVGLRVFPLSNTINVLAICPSSAAVVWTL